MQDGEEELFTHAFTHRRTRSRLHRGGRLVRARAAQPWLYFQGWPGATAHAQTFNSPLAVALHQYSVAWLPPPRVLRYPLLSWHNHWAPDSHPACACVLVHVMHVHACACMCACVRACMRVWVCVCVCMCLCVCAHLHASVRIHTYAQPHSL